MKEFRLNSFQLKWIAIITMVIDHVGAVLYPQYRILRCIGRLSFPVFCFLLTEGFFHTKNVEKYMVRLGLFAILSEIPYDLAFRGNLLDFERQNVFFTLFIGLALMYAMQKSCETWIKVVEVLLAMWIASTLHTDYNLKGILLISIFFFTRNSSCLRFLGNIVWNFMWGISIQNYGGLASIPIALYNGEKGPSMKYFFYVFYPAHLLLLYGISKWIM